MYWLFLYNKSPQNPAAENNEHLSSNIVAESQELRSDSAGWVWLWGSHEVAGWMLAAVMSSEALTKAEHSLPRCCTT